MEEQIYIILKKPYETKNYEILITSIKNFDLKSLRPNFLEKFIEIYQKQSLTFNYYYLSALILNELQKKNLIDIKTSNIQTLLKFINYLLNIQEALNGLDFHLNLMQFIEQISNLMIKGKLSNDKEVLNFIQNVKNKNQGFIGSEINKQMFIECEQLAESVSFDNKMKACQKFIDLLSECNNFQKQQILFSKDAENLIQKIFSNIPWKNEKEEGNIQDILICLGKILLTILIKPEFIVEFNKNKIKNLPQPLEQLIIDKEIELNERQDNNKRLKQNFTDQSVSITYKIPIYTQFTYVYNSVALVINKMLTFNKNFQIQKQCLLILERYIDLFSGEVKMIEEPILQVMSNIIENAENEDQIKFVVIFSIKLLTQLEISEEFRHELQNSEIYDNLCESKFWKEQYVSKQSFLNPNLFSFEDLVIRNCFGISQKILPEQEFFINIEVKKPFSIIYFGFATYQYDVNVKIMKLFDMQYDIQPKLLYQGNIQSEMQPYKIILLIENPGIYRIIFDNKQSWYNQKIIRYRLCVIEPNLNEFEFRKELELFKQVQVQQNENIDISKINNKDQNNIIILMDNFDRIEFELKLQNNQRHITLLYDYQDINQNIDKINNNILESNLLKNSDIYTQPVTIILIINQDIENSLKKQFKNFNIEVLIKIFYFIKKFERQDIQIYQQSDVMQQLYLSKKYEIPNNMSHLIVYVDFERKKMSARNYSCEQLNFKDYSQLFDIENMESFKDIFELKQEHISQIETLQKFLYTVINLSVNKPIERIFLMFQKMYKQSIELKQLIIQIQQNKSCKFSIITTQIDEILEYK